MPRTAAVHRSLTAIALAAVLLAVSMLVAAPQALAYPPDPPPLSTVQTELAAIPTQAEGSMTGYSRDLFPHWITQGGCDTRETVLKRDGVDVVTSSSCAATSGSWYSVYDGAWNYAASDVDIDHVIALAEAWTSGASGWTTTQRRDFANSLGDGQLIAVTDNVNASKSDRDAAEWQPPRVEYHCMFAKHVVHVKYSWGLSMDTAEKAAVNDLLATC